MMIYKLSKEDLVNDDVKYFLSLPFLLAEIIEAEMEKLWRSASVDREHLYMLHWKDNTAFATSIA